MSAINILRAAIRENGKFLRTGLCIFPNFSRGYSSGFDCKDENAETMSEVKFKMMESLGLETGYAPIPKSRDHLLQYQPKLEDLPPRSMQDSFCSAIIPLGQSKSLQDRYVASLGQLRLGRLMEDMDMFAGWVCHQHLKIPTLDPTFPLPYTFVTVLVDKIVFTNFTPEANQDIRLSGHVTWVGKSSLEIVVWLEQLDGDKYRKITRALFLMAARNANNTKSAPVNPLAPASDRERVILSGGLARRQRRQQIQASSLLNVEPNLEEQKVIHELFIRTTKKDTMQLNQRVLPENARWMHDTSVTSTMSSYPQNRNAHNTVFGGFLMRNALEISFVCASLFCGTRPKLETVSDIRFQKVVTVASFLKISSHVVFTENHYIQILTLADILDSATGTQKTSNTFSYTFKSPVKVPEVLPLSYDETLWYIDGRRKFRYAMEPHLPLVLSG